MAKKKKSTIKKLIALELTTATGSVALGTLPPTAVGAAGQSGLAQFSSSFPVAGALAGTELTARAASRTLKATRRLSKSKKKRGKN